MYNKIVFESSHTHSDASAIAQHFSIDGPHRVPASDSMKQNYLLTSNTHTYAHIILCCVWLWPVALHRNLTHQEFTFIARRYAHKNRELKKAFWRSLIHAAMVILSICAWACGQTNSRDETRNLKRWWWDCESLWIKQENNASLTCTRVKNLWPLFSWILHCKPPLRNVGRKCAMHGVILDAFQDKYRENHLMWSRFLCISPKRSKHVCLNNFRPDRNPCWTGKTLDI